MDAAPAPFDCLWCCSPPRGEGRHDMCTGSALRPHMEGGFSSTVVAECACALRRHEPARSGKKPEETTFPTLPDGWTDRRRLRSKTPPRDVR